jgi:hypothetical protein
MEEPFRVGWFPSIPFPRRCAQLSGIAFFMHGFAIFVGFAGSEIYGTMADSARRRIRHAGERKIWGRHGVLQSIAARLRYDLAFGSTINEN